MKPLQHHGQNSFLGFVKSEFVFYRVRLVSEKWNSYGIKCMSCSLFPENIKRNENVGNEEKNLVQSVLYSFVKVSMNI